MIVTTTDVIQGAEIQSYLGIVTAEVVYGTNALRDFLRAFGTSSAGAPAVMRKYSSRGSETPLPNWKNALGVWGQMPSSA